MTETPPDTAETPEAHSWHVPRLIVAWIAAAVMGTLVTLLTAAADRFSWLVLAVGVATLVTFALQLGTAQREGFITRISFSVAGSVVIIAIIDVIGLLL
ncbi:hypothetical protein PQI23_01340 [Leucobacter sp. USCH14]|uniref:hypothetical protein n=1 Tax=Leucobacter sp. USCH14 TaxID=3024838 RepID=UPI0030A97EE0